MKKIVVWGSGAIGGVVGAGMAAAGEDVLMVDINAEHVAAMNERGLTVKFGSEEKNTKVCAAVPDQVTGTFDFVFLAVKSQYREDALTQIISHLTPQSVVVSLQNGVNEPHIAKRIGARRTIGCLVDFSSDCSGPGEITRGRAGNLFVGELDDRMTPRLEEVRRLLSLSVPAFARTNIMGCVWAKICKGTLDANTALVDTDALKLRFDRAYHPIRLHLMREGIKVAAAEGVRVEGFAHFDPAPFLDPSPAGVEAAFVVLDELARGQAHNNTRVRTGYWRDIVVRKRKTELEYVTGEIVRGGVKHGVPTPICTLQMKMFDEIESGRRPMQWENLQELLAEVKKIA